MNLSQLIVLPLFASVLVLICRNADQVRRVALAAAVGQLILTAGLLFAYYNARHAGDTAQMLFQYNTMWFAPLNIHYHVGVDGISVAIADDTSQLPGTVLQLPDVQEFSLSYRPLCRAGIEKTSHS